LLQIDKRARYILLGCQAKVQKKVPDPFFGLLHGKLSGMAAIVRKNIMQAQRVTWITARRSCLQDFPRRTIRLKPR
jgi:hypothetical protein